MSCADKKSLSLRRACSEEPKIIFDFLGVTTPQPRSFSHTLEKVRKQSTEANAQDPIKPPL